MDWKINDGKLTKEYGFDNFNAAMNFVNEVAGLAEQANHHPDIKIHSYNKVCIELFSHDLGKVSDRDEDLALKIDNLYQ